MSAPRQPLRITLLAGGRSPEREVSLESGRCVTQALRLRHHLVSVVDPAECRLCESVLFPCDVVFPMVHGVGGEDGLLQRELQDLRLPFVGSDAAASALTFDKIATRCHLQRAGLPIPPGFHAADVEGREAIAAAAEALGYPIVIKPAAQGSSVGVTVVNDAAKLPDALDLAFSFGSRIVVEQFISGRELTVPVILGQAYPGIEIQPAHGWYDYRAKYLDDQTRYLVDPPDMPVQAADLALAACRACGVAGISRVDFRADASGRCFILEINTIPGMTSHSLVPMSAAARGISPGELCENVLRAAIAAGNMQRRSA